MKSAIRLNFAKSYTKCLNAYLINTSFGINPPTPILNSSSHRSDIIILPICPVLIILNGSISMEPPYKRNV